MLPWNLFTILAFHPRKAEMQVLSLQVAIDHIGDIGPSETIARSIAILPMLFQLLKVFLNTAIIAAGPGISWSINTDIIGYFLARYVKGLDVRDCMAVDCRAAALCVTRPGAADAIPKLEEIKL
jgi:hypothetical protein